MRNMKKKSFLALALTVLLLTVAVSGTIAYLVTNAGPVENQFTYGKVSSQVNETFANNVKSNVTISNTGNVDAYIRAAIVVTWKDSKGYTMPVKPGTDDYTLSIGDQWTKSGDYYYYNGKVAPGEATGVLITNCAPKKLYDDGRTLCVEVIGSAIQAEGMGASNAQEAFSKAWGN